MSYPHDHGVLGYTKIPKICKNYLSIHLKAHFDSLVSYIEN